MEQFDVRLRAAGPDGATADITPLCRSIVWSGDRRSAARTLSFSCAACETDPHLPRAPTELGTGVALWCGDELLMDGYALERTRDSLSPAIDVTAYDRGLYLTRNRKYLRVAGQTPEAVTAALCGEYGIPKGTLASTGVPITRNFMGESLYAIITTLYGLAADQTGKKYCLRFRGPRLETAQAVRSEESVLLRAGSNLLGCVNRESAAGMTNSVAIYDDSCRLLRTRRDEEAAALYGLMEAAIRVGAYDDPDAHAKRLLAENGLSTTITLTARGERRLITGNTCVVREPVTGVCGLFWIISDTHTWKGGVYQTRLALSLEGLTEG